MMRNRPLNKLASPKAITLTASKDNVNFELLRCMKKLHVSILCVHVYLRVEVPEAAAEDTTPKLVMDSIRPPYTILFKISSSVCKTL